MKNLTTFTVLAGVLLPVSAAFAQFNDAADRPTQRFGLSYRAGFNITADFKNLGGLPTGGSPGPATGGGIDRIYDDGYVRVDSSQNANGQTWFWGYQKAGQIQGAPPNSTVTMDSKFASPDASSLNRDGDLQNGFEFTYDYEFGRGPCHGYWGFEAAFNFTDITVRDNNPVTGTISQISDTFSLQGSVAPQAGYAGTHDGPGVVIADSPTSRSITPAGATLITGSRSIDADVFGFRLGPYWEVPVSRNISLTLSGGLALAEVHSHFTFQETVTAPGLPTSSDSGSNTRDELLAGGYVSGQVRLAMTHSWSIFGGVQFQDVGIFSQEAAGKEATLDLSQSLFMSLGFSYSFK